MGKGIVLVFLLVALFLVVYPQVTVKNVTLVVDGEAEVIATRAGNVGEVLEEQGLYVRGNDILEPQEETSLVNEMEIILQRAVPVFVEVDGETRLVYSAADNVESLLGEVNVSVEEEDRVEPGLSAGFTHGDKIAITRVHRKLVTEEKSVPYETEQKNDSSLAQGRRNVEVDGKPGTLIKTYEVIVADGEEEKRVLVDEELAEEPVNRVVRIGTKVERPEPVITASARSGRVGEVIEGEATWYGPGFHGNRTANGEIFDQNALTAAFPSHSMMGRNLRVTNTRNGRSVVVRVNDFGPSTGAIIDLSKAAAEAIGMVSAGRANVKVEVLE
ncbi:septal ring lytic transglycosylase RlpA family protein [Dethiobacter alkaliphilus]|uniref:septal ring lytic transglycosylase RlpA family protein n=1 Tax=Dethiobacter alkaliphilus TaxID=427926 RepID=UPI00030D51EF|nr:septal ring lytic transglycosylase RlpA family protein [Dethiobacter alkaliphilus]